MSANRSISSVTHRRRRSMKHLTNQYINWYVAALRENAASIPKIFVDGELHTHDLINETAHNQTQVCFHMCVEGGPRTLRYRLNFLEDETLIALQQVLSASNYPNLTDLRFEFCNLSYDQLIFIRMILQENKQILHLSVNGNPQPNVADEDGHHLPIHGTHLKMYSLQLCKLTPSNASLFYHALHRADKYTRNLVSLNLGCNRLGDEGCALMSLIIRENRHLQALNLSENLISERALIELFGGLARFRLTVEETKYKRQIKLLSLMTGNIAHVNPWEDSYDTTSSTPLSDSNNSDSDTLRTHPFLADTIIDEHNEYVCSGNNALLHLNISYNEITANVLEAIIATVNYQKSNFKIGGLQRVLVESRKQFPDLIQEMNRLLYHGTIGLGHRQTKRPNSIP